MPRSEQYYKDLQEQRLKDATTPRHLMDQKNFESKTGKQRNEGLINFNNKVTMPQAREIFYAIDLRIEEFQELLSDIDDPKIKDETEEKKAVVYRSSLKMLIEGRRRLFDNAWWSKQ